MRRHLPLLALCAATVFSAAPASAAVIPIGTGQLPGLTVDANGTAYVAWLAKGSADPQPLYFCRLPRGATACDPAAAQTIPAPGASTRRPFIVASGARVVVVQARYGGGIPGFSALLRFTSNDGGNTFGAGEVVGDASVWEATPGPGDTLSGVTSAEGGGTQFQNVPLAGAPALKDDGTSATGKAVLSASKPYDGAVGLDGSTPVAVFSDGSGNTDVSRASGGDPNVSASWTAPVGIGVTAYPKLASGPSGLFLLSSDTQTGVYVRRFDGTTFGAPVSLGITDNSPGHHVFQDASGRLHAVFNHPDAAGAHLIYATSDDGTGWVSESLVDQTDPADGTIASLRVATAPDHIGVAVYQAGGDGSSIRVVGLGPEARRPAPTIKTGTAVAKLVGGVYKVTLRNSLVLPPGLSAAQYCTGSVKVVIKRGSKRIKSITVKVKPNCTYVVKVKLKKRKVKKAKKLKATHTFSGNAYAGARIYKNKIRVQR